MTNWLHFCSRILTWWTRQEKSCMCDRILVIETGIAAVTCWNYRPFHTRVLRSNALKRFAGVKKNVWNAVSVLNNEHALLGKLKRKLTCKCWIQNSHVLQRHKHCWWQALIGFFFHLRLKYGVASFTEKWHRSRLWVASLNTSRNAFCVLFSLLTLEWFPFWNTEISRGLSKEFPNSFHRSNQSLFEWLRSEISQDFEWLPWWCPWGRCTSESGWTSWSFRTPWRVSRACREVRTVRFCVWGCPSSGPRGQPAELCCSFLERETQVWTLTDSRHLKRGAANNRISNCGNLLTGQEEQRFWLKQEETASKRILPWTVVWHSKCLTTRFRAKRLVPFGLVNVPSFFERVFTKVWGNRAPLVAVSSNLKEAGQWVKVSRQTIRDDNIRENQWGESPKGPTFVCGQRKVRKHLGHHFFSGFSPVCMFFSLCILHHCHHKLNRFRCLQQRYLFFYVVDTEADTVASMSKQVGLSAS